MATKSATYDKTVSNLMECKARGAKVIGRCHRGRRGDQQDRRLYHPRAGRPRRVRPITASVPLQLLAREVAILRGCDVDQPANLAKSVTVE